jgi:fermentation-respiration switch protein FrsA (DUF1100 family)
VNRAVYDIARSDTPTDAARGQVIDLLTKAGVPAEVAPRMADQGLLPWVRWFLRHDPGPDLARLRMPVLALQGSLDKQVVPDVNLPALRAALASDPQATVVELPGLNHLLQTARTGLPREYGAIEETIAPAALTLMSDWVAKTTHATAPAP